MRNRSAACPNARADRVGPGGQHLVLRGAVGRPERRGHREVVREVGETAARGRPGGLERASDPQMQRGSPWHRQPVVGRAPHQLVREPPGAALRLRRLDHPDADGLVERRDELRVVEPGGGPDDVGLECRTRGRGEVEYVARPGGKPREAEPDHLAHALWRLELLG